MVVSYLELYEEGEVEHINGVWPVFLFDQLLQYMYPLGENKIPQSRPHLALLISLITVPH